MTWAPASLGLSGLLTGWIPRQLLFLVGNAMNSILILFIHRYQSNFSPSMLILAHWQEMRAKLLNGTVQWNAYHIAIFWGDTVAKYNVSSRRSQKIGLRTTKSSFFFSFFLPWKSSPKLWSEKKTGENVGVLGSGCQEDSDQAAQREPGWAGAGVGQPSKGGQRAGKEHTGKQSPHECWPTRYSCALQTGAEQAVNIPKIWETCFLLQRKGVTHMKKGETKMDSSALNWSHQYQCECTIFSVYNYRHKNM